MAFEKNINIPKILQVNLEDSGGAFSLIFQLQKKMEGEIAFDYYSMGSFKSQVVIDEIYRLGGTIYEARLRSNRFFGSLMLPFQFYKFLKTYKYECIHIHSDTAWKLLEYAYPAKKAGVKKIIIHSHSTDINGDYRWLKKICHVIARIILPKYADIYLTCSDKASQWMFPKINNEQIIWIKNGIDTSKFQFNIEARNQIREKMGIADDMFLIGVVGDMSYQKNPEYIVDVFEQIIKERDSFKLVFIGDGNYTDSVKEYVKEKRMEESVIFYGRTLEIEKVLSAIDIFAMPSRFEGLPVSAIEAQASGLPCVISLKVTKQTAVCDNCRFIDINNESKMEWARSIMLIEKNEDRTQAYQNVMNAGFDIGSTACHLKGIYLET
jgi:glycosyltransferase involved in cell wall biosynthesis